MSDDTWVLVMLAAVAVYGLYYLVKTVFAANRLEALHRNPPRRVINGKEYLWITNIKRRVTSMMDPRPNVVIAEIEREGWEVAIQEDARDVYGGPVPECRSVWGRRRA